MELFFAMIMIWVFIKVLQWLWPLIKFGSLFIGALLVFGSWFLFKEVSQIGAIMGGVAVITGAYKFAKSKS